MNKIIVLQPTSASPPLQFVPKHFLDKEIDLLNMDLDLPDLTRPVHITASTDQSPPALSAVPLCGSKMWTGLFRLLPDLAWHVSPKADVVRARVAGQLGSSQPVAATTPERREGRPAIRYTPGLADDGHRARNGAGETRD